MKSLFQSRPLHLSACILLFWKGISLVVWFLLQEFGVLEIGREVFFSTGFASPLVLVLGAAFSDNPTVAVVLLSVMCLAVLAYWVLFVLLAINRSGAGVASVGLLVLCGLDLPVTVGCAFEAWWSILVCIVFHSAVFLAVVLLRRSRPGASVPLTKVPASI